MTLLSRSMALLTIALAIALMAAFTFAAAAKNEGAAPAANVTAVDEPAAKAFLPLAKDRLDAMGGPWSLLLDDSQSDLAIPELVAQAAQPTASPPPTAPRVTPTPIINLFYAAPLGASAVGAPRGGRSGLASQPRVWNVASVPPGATNASPSPSLPARGGLDVPPDQLAAMQRVSMLSGIPWQVLAGIAKVESDFGRNMATSSAGAIGYGQFMPAQWEIHGDGGDPYDFNDVLPAMARYLLVANALEDMPGAIYAYNHSWDYVALVLDVASSYGYPDSPDLAASSDELIWPVVGPISTYFGPDHAGLDIGQAHRPGAPVLAAHDGVVYFAGGEACCSYGYYVILIAPTGLATLYAHFESIDVRPGETIRQGQTLGATGCTGYCTGTHLHLEVIEDSTRRDPLEYLP